ncbi:hypothetical protein [Bartonella raoultii]|nr:hypothetical protein [Bartonella raoultii]
MVTLEESVARTDDERYFSLSLISGYDEQQLLFYGDGGYALNWTV